MSTIESGYKLKVRKAGTTESKDDTPQRSEKTPALRKILELSKDEFCKINWYYPGGREAFPTNQKLWTVDRYFPYARGGALLCDLIALPHKLKEARMKKPFLEEKGLRYVAVKVDGTILNLDDTALNESNFLAQD